MEVNWVDATTILELVSQVGVLGAILIGSLWKLNTELDKRDTYHNERHQEMKEELKELRDENKQDKAMFMSAIQSFDLSVKQSSDMFNNMSSKMTNLEFDVKEIKNNVRELKKIEKE